MKIFITGATGYLGEAVVRELQHSHDVIGLTRSEEGAALLESHGVRPVVADIQETGDWVAEAASASALIHLAEDTDDREAADRAGIDGLLEAARSRGGPKTLIYTSGCFVLGETGDQPADESAALDHPAEVVTFRVDHERRVLDESDDELATSVIRPVIVYGGADGLVSTLFESAVERGAAEYVGDGTNRWTLVHRDDVARLYHLVLERGARGIYHAAEPGFVRVGEIARVASQAAGYGGTTRAIPLEEARESMGATADAIVMTQEVVAPRALELGWKPRHAAFRQSVEQVYHEWKSERERRARNAKA